jgi:glycosyltransferase involved in cell wall biosynthesis
MLAAIAGRTLKTPAVVSCDSGEFVALSDIGYGSQLRPSGRAAVAIACRLATRVHVTTRFMADEARAHGVDTIRIPVGVDTSRVGVREPLAEGPPWRLLQVASLNPVKDQAMLLTALRIVREKMDVRLDLVGEDTLGGVLQRQAAESGLADAVGFHGWRPHDALQPFYAAAHLYVQSSRHEGDGIAVLEACAVGVPVAGTAVGYVCDLAPHAALAVPPSDPVALAAAMIRLIQSPTERSSIADAARDFARSHDADWTARKLVELYASLTSSWPLSDH